MDILVTSLRQQFVDHRADPLSALRMFGAIINALGLIWLTGFAVLVARSRTALSTPRVGCLQERLTGTVLIGLGVSVALERR